MSSEQVGDIRRIGEDPDAFEDFYRLHLPMVRGFVARRVSDPQVAADLIADVFVAAIEHARSYRQDRGEPSAWLAGIARNLVAGEQRRVVRHRNATRRIEGRRLLDPDATERIAGRIDAERQSRELYEALAGLPQRDRALVELVALDGLSVTEAAAVLGVKPSTARVRLHRSRIRLQSTLLPQTEAALT